VAPDVPLEMFSGLAGPITTYMARTMGSSLALAAVVAFCLKDAAERHVLHFKTFRLLNAGLAASSAAQATTLLLAVNGGWAGWDRSWAVLGVLAALAAWCGANAFAGAPHPDV
jgi:multidrug efflux pump subunit AcrB